MHIASCVSGMGAAVYRPAVRTELEPSPLSGRPAVAVRAENINYASMAIRHIR